MSKITAYKESRKSQTLPKKKTLNNCQQDDDSDFGIIAKTNDHNHIPRSKSEHYCKE